MADFIAPPPGPPPPKVPEGWVARWNDQYKEWFYVNTYTKKSQWEKPTEPAVPPRDESAPAGPPPSYSAGDSKHAPSDSKSSHSNNPYDNPANRSDASHSYEDEDARLARQLQAEEDARAAAAANQRAHTPSGGQQSPFPSQLPPRPDANDRGSGSKGSFLGKIFGAAGKVKPSGSSSHGYGGGGYPAQGHSPAPYAQQQQPMYAQQQGPPQGGYGGYPPQQGYAPQQGYYQQQQAYGRPARSGGGGGMGMMGGAALGLGAGVLGGALIADAVNDHDQEIYQDGYNDGNDGGDMDFGGDDF
ncbi:unnamed protein product [Sordaria macrospora k-hell]|uniref:WGS project CABT00000000 data, contig 2.3 n=1 Tax=Sordaria macrospora (strain ATCC MYA-333 / DSM 997 / K(L3346) / K-hell) TaxID=771870 RepID=F7VPE2_SORMK|nr:uncharacterized protein SMAC_02378 [Sordaria macrospora k-hell]CCC07370.1 unnamed protein product [Sordaria macrospora k-hell]